MTVKLRVAPILDTPYECPFYREDNNNAHQCLFKLATPIQSVISVVDDNSQYDPEAIADDCKGEWNKCLYLPLLYNISDIVSTNDIESELEPESVDSSFSEYNPFDISDDDQTLERSDAPKLFIPTVEPLKVETPQDQQKELTAEDKESIQERDHSVKVWVSLVPDIYRFKTDILVYPTNGDLEIEDMKLFDMSHGNIQQECNKYPRPIQMGQIYVTSNGGDFKNGVAASCVYHAVVASPMRVVNEGDVAKCMKKALARSDSRGAKSIAFMPADMGNVDINQMALIQLSTLYKALATTNFQSLSDIFVVMDDEPSYKAFRLYLLRMFMNYEMFESTEIGEKYVCAEIDR